MMLHFVSVFSGSSRLQHIDLTVEALDIGAEGEELSRVDFIWQTLRGPL